MLLLLLRPVDISIGKPFENSQLAIQGDQLFILIFLYACFYVLKPNKKQQQKTPLPKAFVPIFPSNTVWC